MKKLLFLSIIFTTYLTFAQTNTEVYVFDIRPAYEGLELLNIQNISNNKGYNNQPSFIANETLVFAGNNEGQTDIVEYSLNTKSKKWFNQNQITIDKDGKKLSHSFQRSLIKIASNFSYGKFNQFLEESSSENNKYAIYSKVYKTLKHSELLNSRLLLNLSEKKIKIENKNFEIKIVR